MPGSAGLFGYTVTLIRSYRIRLDRNTYDPVVFGFTVILSFGSTVIRFHRTTYAHANISMGLSKNRALREEYYAIP